MPDNWICDTCVHSPPSSTDGKPCSMCNPEDPFMSSYQLGRKLEKVWPLNTITKEITLTINQWEKLKHALDFYENAARTFMSYTDGKDFRAKYILPVYNQMPNEVF